MAARAATHAVVSTEELRAADLSPRQIDHLARIGFLHRRHQGVWAIGRPDLGFDGLCRAGLLVCGPQAALCGPTAAVRWGFHRGDERIHVSAPRSRTPQEDIVVHRPRSLPPQDVREREGFRLTCVGRTLLDLSPRQPIERIGGWIHEAKVQLVFDSQETWAVLERNPHHRGRRLLEAALAAEFLPTRSGLEDAFLGICRRAGLPTPVVNAELWSGEGVEEVDFHWPDARLIVETDGGRYHASRWRRRRDAAKDERFRGQGWHVERVPELEITLDPAGVGLRLAPIVWKTQPTA